MVHGQSGVSVKPCQEVCTLFCKWWGKTDFWSAGWYADLPFRKAILQAV